ncbi:ATP-binding protein [Bacillus sp. sid0103]|uniref:ATP-binding protein n=1 Tax=Bacillus sp. sid0103 TaxID=2856337 RepID=UPI00210E34EF|nr:ATP-binding protein [Bacillus sp. sid0103]
MIELPHVFDQVLIVLFPILVYQLFFNESDYTRRKPYAKLSMLLLIMLLLTMSFPIELEKGYYYDFRVIPVIISFVYAGVIPSFILVTVLFLYRFYLGGDGIYLNLVNIILITSLLLFFKLKCQSFLMKNKTVVVSIIYLASVVIKLIYLFKYDQTEQIAFTISFYIISWISLLMVVFIIDYVDQHVKIQKELQRAEKLNVISQLAASVAHEVRNPMTTVNGFLQLMRSDTHLDNNHKDYIDISLRELNHAQSIINDYLSLAKPNTEGVSAINLSNEVKNVIGLITSYSTIKNIRIESSIQDSLYMNGNRDELKQILVNIIKNGIEAIEDNGLLTVNAYLHNHDEIIIEVIDTGIGMTKEQVSKVGTPFYSTKDKGTGVGLTISYQLVHSMKGKVKIESEPGKGTTFILTFPAVTVD